MPKRSKEPICLKCSQTCAALNCRFPMVPLCKSQWIMSNHDDVGTKKGHGNLKVKEANQYVYIYISYLKK